MSKLIIIFVFVIALTLNSAANEITRRGGLGSPPSECGAGNGTVKNILVYHDGVFEAIAMISVKGYVTLSPLFFKLSDALKGKCNKEEELHQRCSMALPVLSSPEISFALTREELDKSCVELRAGIKCIENFTEICMEKSEQVTFRRIYAGITDVVQELCTRGKYQDEYLRHAGCVKNVRSEYEVCSKKYEVTLTTLSNHQMKDQYHTDQTDLAPTHEDFSRTVCCSFQEYLMCSELTVQRSCGDEAALFTSAFLKRMASNIIKNFCLEYRGQECGLSDKAATTDHNILLITLTLIAVFSSDITNLVLT